jgi:hypothetical protein
MCELSLGCPGPERQDGKIQKIVRLLPSEIFFAVGNGSCRSQKVPARRYRCCWVFLFVRACRALSHISICVCGQCMPNWKALARKILVWCCLIPDAQLRFPVFRHRTSKFQQISCLVAGLLKNYVEIQYLVPHRWNSPNDLG